MEYQERLIDLLDRKYRLVTESPQEDFWLEVARFIQFIQDDETLGVYTKRLLKELEDRANVDKQKLNEEVEEANRICQAFIKRFPDLDDSKIPRPNPTKDDDIIKIAYHDPYFHSFAWFNELVEKTRAHGSTLWSRTINPDSQDQTELSTLLKILEDKLADLPNDNVPEDIFVRFRNLQARYHQLRQEFIINCRSWPPASLGYLRDLVAQINPIPKQFTTLHELIADQLSFDQLFQPQIDPDESLFHLRRVYERIRADIGSHLSHHELIQRYKARCMFYDRERLDVLVRETGRQKEDILTRDLALYLFDNGVSTLYRLKRGIHEYDLFAPSIFIEAKQYSSAEKERLINGISQLHAYLNGLEDTVYIQEAYYVIFRLSGPVYDWPDKIPMNRWTIYPITIDIGPSRISGSRQPKTTKISLDDIYYSTAEKQVK